METPWHAAVAIVTRHGGEEKIRKVAKALLARSLKLAALLKLRRDGPPNLKMALGFRGSLE